MTRMSRDERIERDLQRFHDGELGFWGRRRMERRLRASAELRERLQELRDLGDLMREMELDAAPQERPDVWSVVGPALAGIDSELSSPGGSGAGRRRWRVPEVLEGWRPLAGATVATAAALLAFFLLEFPAAVPENGSWTAAGPVGEGALRYLKTDGRPVVVSQEQEGVTIIWLMDPPSGA